MPFEGWFLKATAIGIWVALGLGLLFGIAVALRYGVEIAFRIIGHAPGDQWTAFCTTIGDKTDHLLRRFGGIYLVVLAGLAAATWFSNLGKPSGGECGWAGLMCEGSTEE